MLAVFCGSLYAKPKQVCFKMLAVWRGFSKCHNSKLVEFLYVELFQWVELLLGLRWNYSDIILSKSFPLFIMYSFLRYCHFFGWGKVSCIIIVFYSRVVDGDGICQYWCYSSVINLGLGWVSCWSFFNQTVVALLEIAIPQ